MNEDTILHASDVTVTFGSTRALDGVTFVAKAGATGLLGPNGAGKSTLIKVLLGLLPPDAGDLKVLSLSVKGDARLVRQQVGYMPEHDGYIPGLSGVQFVAYMGELSGLTRREAMARSHEVLYYVGLGEARYRPIDTYSTGMKQRAKLAQALVHDPKLLFLDEPTNGLDPRGRQEMLAFVQDIAERKGMSVILSSHLLPDVEATCRDVVMLHRGKVLMAGAIRDLTLPTTRQYEVRIKGEPARFREEAGKHGLRILEDDASPEGSVMVLEVPAGWDGPTGARAAGGVDAPAEPIFAAAAAAGAQVRHLLAKRPSLEEVFQSALKGQAA